MEAVKYEHMEDSGDDDGDDDAWLEDDEIESVETKCLFCSTKFKSPDAVFSHCSSSHDFDIKHFCMKWDLDCFGYIKMVNFIRGKKPDVNVLAKFANSSKPPWDSDEFMQPVDPDDPLLQYDIEDLESNEPECHSSNVENSAKLGDQQTVVRNGVEGPLVTMATTQHEALLLRLQRSEEKARQCEENLQRALADMENIKQVTRDLMLAQPSTVAPSPGDGDKQTDIEEDDPYFSSYGHFSIHEEMLKDKVRTESYRDFMYKNPNVFKDKIVLDVGCGTGILSMFAVQAGAQHVYAVDMADIIYQAMDIARENKLSDKITFIKGKLEDIELPVEKVDIIISEWMGYFLLFESMLDSVLFARAKYLKPGGAVYPDRCNISIAAISDLDLYNKHVTYWDDVYGFKMTCMKSCVVREASVEVVKKESQISNACIVKDLDINTCGLEDLQFTSIFSVKVSQTGNVTALIGFFDIFFDMNCSTKIEFSTSPDSIPTHWKQTLFLLDKPLQCQQGDILEGKLTCRKNRKDTRSLIINIILNDKNLTYYME
ncbi:protein arginine N-methyltransferase 3-like [Ruditapes philippinarum]|uniref:protein arginine N-methyltransferase 3-like n=1 Tax=Ruditapes philippinarum TaxID=129788 RepID=UPI00295B6D85|nr:protein arginine N-methyltransferase 3-like [Ruditapes philippinarum]